MSTKSEQLTDLARLSDAFAKRGLSCSGLPENQNLPGLTYVLILRVPSAMRIDIGRLARKTFAPGWLYYVGSAKRAAAHRLRRHLAAQKKIHWHIDYLTSHPRMLFCGVMAWKSNEQTECGLVAELADRNKLAFAVPGFGTGDCRSGCVSHLLLASDAAVHRQILHRLSRRAPKPLFFCSQESKYGSDKRVG